MNNKEISILIVDDEEDTRTLLCTLLATRLKIEHTCVGASSAEEAMRLLEASFFHLVLTDIELPGASGLELCNLVHQTYPNTIVMIMSGMSDIQYAINAMRQGAFDYLLKPITASQFFWSVERALNYQEHLMARYYCEQSLEEEIHDLLSLNARLRKAMHRAAPTPEKRAAKSQGS